MNADQKLVERFISSLAEDMKGAKSDDDLQRFGRQLVNLGTLPKPYAEKLGPLVCAAYETASQRLAARQARDHQQILGALRNVCGIQEKA